MGVARPMVFIRTDNGCLICISHKLNHDGYLRKLWKKAGVPVSEMFHRFIYRAHKGEIPEGCEVDHICNVRPCCNPDHLQVLSRSEHLDKTNRNRYADRKSQAKAYWEEHKPKGVTLGELFGVSFSSACRWIREWSSPTPQTP